LNAKQLVIPVVSAALLTVASVVAGGAGAQRGGDEVGGAHRLAKDEPQTITLTSAKDNTLHESADGSVSDGSGSYMFAGNSNQQVIRRAVLEFDVASSIPANAEVDRVTLTLNMSRTSSGAQTVQLFRVLSEWGEGSSNADGNEGSGAPAADGDATWLHTSYPDQQWTSAGGDFADGASASATVADTGLYEWSSDDMADEVEAWLADPSSNHGWILIGQERSGNGQKLSRTSKRFDTHENPHDWLRPKLVVEFRVEDGSATPETATPETSTPETSTPETSTPETSTPETETPETSTPETETPETSTPETETPETSTPETSTPETPTPETSTPDTSTGRIYLPIARRGA